MYYWGSSAWAISREKQLRCSLRFTWVCSQWLIEKREGWDHINSVALVQGVQEHFFLPILRRQRCMHVPAWKPWIFQIKPSPKSKHKVEFKTAQTDKPHITRSRRAWNPDNVTIYFEAMYLSYVTANPAGIYWLGCSEVWRNTRSYPRSSKENYEGPNKFMHLFL